MEQTAWVAKLAFKIAIKLAMFSALISLLTGCKTSPPTPPPKKPGVSIALNYPVVLVGDRRLIVKDDEPSLITTTVSSGVGFPEYRFIDSSGTQYSVKRVTEFGRKNAFLNMGTSPFQVFLELKSEGKISLEKAKSVALEAALKPEGVLGPHGKEIATERIHGAKSVPDLIEVCRDPLERK
jgi:hypothetical protein